jgi:GMP synthase (glutamine-hydrolysing)
VRALVLQHIACEPPGVYEDVLVERGVEIARVELDEGDPLPTGETFDLIVAMGGPMSVNDEAELPWLRDEKDLIRSAVEAGTPFWGVCLGVQLLASALGAGVCPVEKPEVGVLPVRLTDDALADPIFAGLPRDFVTLQWHGDTFELPSGATLLASSRACENQAFRFRRAYGVQFHLEVSGSMAEEWSAVPAYAESLARVRGPGALQQLLAEYAEHRDEVLSIGRTLFAHWLDTVVSSAAAAA